MANNLYKVTDNTDTVFASDVDQLVDALNGVNDIGVIQAYNPIAVPGAPTVAVNVTAGNLSGAYLYKIAFVTGYWKGQIGTGTILTDGNTGGGTVSASVSPAAQQVNLTAIPVGPVGTVARIIYRTKAGGSTYFQVAQINDNTTTSYTDNIADASITVAMPATNTTGTYFAGDGHGLTNIPTTSLTGFNKLDDGSGNAGFGSGLPATLPLFNSAAGRRFVTVKGASDGGVLEFGTGATDATGVLVGQLAWTDMNSTNTDKRVAFIHAVLSGATANNRGGDLIFGTRDNAGTALVNRMRINATGVVGVGTDIPTARFHAVIAGNNPARPTGTWAGAIENTVDVGANHGLSVATRRGDISSTIFEAATYWTGSAEAYTPIFSVLGDKSVKTRNNVLDDGAGYMTVKNQLFTNAGVGVGGGNVHYFMRSATGVVRIGMGLGGDESTGNLGSNYTVWSYSNTGAFVATLLTIARDGSFSTKNNNLDDSLGNATFAGNVSIQHPGDSTLTIEDPNIVNTQYRRKTIFSTANDGFSGSGWLFRATKPSDGTIIDTKFDTSGGIVYTTGNSPASKAASGYQKLASGVLIQWGLATSVGNGGSVTFPIAFPTGCYNVTVEMAIAGAARTGTNNLSTTGFSLWQDYGTAQNFYWFAIGY